MQIIITFIVGIIFGFIIRCMLQDPFEAMLGKIITKQDKRISELEFELGERG